jgi:glycosyltransferase involved in cell wall biosynthesis
MKVLHLSTTDIQGGAARGAFWLHTALRRHGVDSQILVDRKYSDCDSVMERSFVGGRVARALVATLDSLPLRMYRKSVESYWSVGWMPNGIPKLIASSDADIIHLHWVGQGFVPIGALPRFGRPVVWTMRDMWSFTGGCHHTTTCTRFQGSCGACPQLRSNSERDLSRRVWESKHYHWRSVDLWLVAISNWLADCAKKSSLFRDRHVSVIPNGVDIRRFRPIDKKTARARLGLPLQKRLVLFGGIDPIREQRKGFQYFSEAARILASNGQAETTEIIVFGRTQDTTLQSLPLPCHRFGHLDDDELLANIYSSADVLVAPSIFEPFGKTLIEAMACGTPVVAFDNGGPRDIVEHQMTGFLAPVYSADALARGISWCLAGEDRAAALGRRARTRVEARFDIDAVAMRYAALYEQILGSSHEAQIRHS